MSNLSEEDVVGLIRTQGDRRYAQLSALPEAFEGMDASDRAGVQNALSADGFIPLRLQKFRASLANTLLGVTDTDVLVIGESTMAGRGSNGASGNSGYDGAKVNSLPVQIARQIERLGIPAAWDSLLGSGGLGSNYPGYDTRLSFGSGWGTVGTATQQSFGYEPFENNSTTNALTFTPVGAWDTADVYYISQSGYATFTIACDGVVKATPNSNAATALRKVTVTADSLKVQSLAIARNGTGTSARIVGFVCRNSTQKRVNVMVSAKGGTKIADWTLSGAAYNVINSFDDVLPKLTVISCSINDWNAATDLTAFRNSYAALITAAQVYGDVVLLDGNPSATPGFGYATAEVQAQYADALESLASQYGCLFLSQLQRFGSYTFANARGFYTDPLHLSAVGQMDIGRWVAETLLR